MWPNARISVMGGYQAADVLGTIKKKQLEKDGKTISAQELDELKQPIMAKYEKEGHPYYASARLWDDGVINPTETRSILINALQAVNNKSSPDANFPVFRM
jgi:3-methylcrotonyl-CoA carboxylase beta subunit